MIRNLRTFGWGILSASILCNPMRGQGPVIMTVDTQSVVEYQADTGNVPQYATNSNEAAPQTDEMYIGWLRYIR